MKSLWRDMVSDPKERRVIEALEDPRWDFRTVPGLAESTDLPEHVIRDVLNRYPEFVRQSLVPDLQGRELYTLASRGRGLREWYAITRAFITKSVGA